MVARPAPGREFFGPGAGVARLARYAATDAIAWRRLEFT